MVFLGLKLPVLFINFKTYKEATGKKAVALAKKALLVSKKAKKNIAVVVQTADIRLVSDNCSLPVFAQHIDSVSCGAFTGWTSPFAVKNAGAFGTVLNHAEHKLGNELLEKAIECAKNQGLAVMACAESLGRAVEIAGFSFKPDFIAIEPPELISGNVSVCCADPCLIRDSVVAVKKVSPEINVIAGAGIKSGADSAKAIELGACGVFVASGVVKSKNQESAILEIISGFK